jgi:Lar family restriction alleviation protein
MKELKPCPFCGEKTNIMITGGGTHKYYFAECESLDTECAGSFDVECAYRSEEELIEAWNKRASPWISVEKSPETNGLYFVRIRSDYTEYSESTAYWNEKLGWDCDDITEWMPIPE